MDGTTISSLDEDASIRNIIKEIIRECKSKKINVNKNFVTFLTKLLSLNPNWGIGHDFFKQRQNVQHFVEYIIDELLAKQDTPEVVTLKIQFYFSCNMDNAEYIIQSNRTDLKNRLKILCDDILVYNKFKNKRDIDVLYKKMVYYIIFSSGLGNPGTSKIYEEVLVALKSILNEDELKGFVELPKKDKLAQLNQFTFVVGGIRIFNKDCNKGGEGITNLPQLMPKAISVIKESTEDTLLSIMEKVNLLTTAVEKSYVIKQIDKGYKMSLQNSVELNEALRQPDIYFMQNLLIFFRQYELIVRQILEEMDHIQESCEISLVGMEKLIRIIHDTVDMKIGVPAELVFPLFEDLWLLWEQFQNQSFLLTRLNDIMNNLYHFSKQTGFHKFDVLVESMTDAERLAENLHLSLIPVNPELCIIKHENVKNIDNIKLQYLGFCCWMLVETGGGLIPGNPHMGIVEYKGKYYVFSSYEAYNMFAIDPQIYVNGVLELGRSHPQLVNFLQLQKDLEGVSNIEKLVQVKIEIRGCDDKYIQTDDNFEPYIDPNYKWNVWELKREALIKINLSHRTTASTQTRNTNSKCNIKTQTCKPGKTVACQTTRNVSTNTSKSAT